MALGGWLPAAGRGVYFPLRFLTAEDRRNAVAIWRQKLCTSKADKAIDLQNFATKLIGITRLV